VIWVTLASFKFSKNQGVTFSSDVGDDQVINIDSDDQSITSPAPRLHTVCGAAPLETKPGECGVELGIIGLGRLSQAIQSLAQTIHLGFIPDNDEIRGLLDVDLFRQRAVEEGALHVHVVGRPAMVCHQCHHHAHLLQPCDWSEYHIKVDVSALNVPLCHQASLVPHDLTGLIPLHLIHPFEAYGMVSSGQRC
jgi:hypothetical protein